MKIGLDFDNTIICYDQLFYELAIKNGYVFPNANLGKQFIRDALRLLPDGEIAWQRLQAEVYGPKIAGGILKDGLKNFLKEGVLRGVTFYIVSHKSRFAAQDKDCRDDLIIAALKWLVDKRIVGVGCPVDIEHVYFLPTLLDKVKKIQTLGCNFFVDDLLDTFEVTDFPSTTCPILFDPHFLANRDIHFTLCHSWQDIKKKCFDVREHD